MPSPFPGMNPYLEHPSVWHDFHQSFMPAAREYLSPQVRPRYFVKIDEHIYIHEPEAERDRLAGRGDVLLLGGHGEGPTGGSGTELLDAPAQVQQVVVDEERVPFLEIRDRESQQVITVVELLSPSNKYAGPDREQYLGKHYALLKSQVNLVEIDLLRGGPRMPWLDLPVSDYCVVVSRWYRRPFAGVWPIRLREPLPEIRVPLRQGEPDARLDLQQVLHRIYDGAGYGDFIYAKALEPALSEEDAAWAESLIGRSE